MININEFIKEGKVALTVGANDLKEFAKDIIQQTKKEMEDLINEQKSEKYLSRKQVCEILNIDKTTAWRWQKKNYLVPVTVGGKKRYKRSDVDRLLCNN